MQKIVKLVVFLALISGLSGMCLSLVNDVTKPIIDEQKLAAVKVSLNELYSGSEFEEISGAVADTAIQNIYKVDGGEGYVYKVGVTGYGGEVTYLVGINKDASYQGFIALTYDGETSGFGTRIADEEFGSQFTGSIDDGVDTLSGATITSTAVVKGVNQVVDHFNANYK